MAGLTGLSEPGDNGGGAGQWWRGLPGSMGVNAINDPTLWAFALGASHFLGPKWVRAKSAKLAKG